MREINPLDPQTSLPMLKTQKERETAAEIVDLLKPLSHRQRLDTLTALSNKLDLGGAFSKGFAKGKRDGFAAAGCLRPSRPTR